ncbi:MAG: hypothetical protein JXX14_04530, partial [Deltaproteobacteria bacterium]|nr:hypothetical protein [Deltaproteobacteria bacterium]
MTQEQKRNTTIQGLNINLNAAQLKKIELVQQAMSPGFRVLAPPRCCQPSDSSQTSTAAASCCATSSPDTADAAP